RAVGFLLRKSAVTFVLYILLSVVAIFGFLKWPSSFIPNEDQGFFVAQVQLEDGASQHQTTMALNKVFDILDTIPEVENYLSINGFSMLQGSAMSNYATLYVMLKPWDERRSKDQSGDAVVARFNRAAARIADASIQAFVPPPIPGLGSTGGFELMLQNNNNAPLADMQAMVENIVDAAPSTPGLMYLSSGFSASVPQKYLNIDRDKVKMQKLQIGDVFSTLSAYMASAYVNDFVKYGRVYKVLLESDAGSRANVNNILGLTVKNADGEMVPFSSFTTIEDRLGPNVITRYNLYPSASIMGMGSVGTSSGQALGVMENLVNDKAGNAYAYQWTGTAFQEQRAGSSTMVIFLLAIFVVLMVLAAQYESLTSPFAVVMGLPIALLGVIIGCLIMGESLSVYSQIGIILLIGLAAKNAILIVEFARDYRKEGATIRRAAAEAGEVRFRPIIMTSLAFILGVYPLVVASGAGAVARVSLGTAVFFGMLVSTILGTLFIPSYYEWWEKIQTRFSRKK
ncbi:MAG: efflux RND transporter permease subunit, partial [Bacteroidales bacterium]|nr:efflux RND transporter permease subunit [Bacteroidales bacterium]